MPCTVTFCVLILIKINTVIAVSDINKGLHMGAFDWLDLNIEKGDPDTNAAGIENAIDDYESDFISVGDHPDETMRDMFVNTNTGLGIDYSNGRKENSWTTYTNKRRVGSRRKTPSIPINGRSFISRFQTKRFPYSNIVHLSTGCTGTLLTPYHVLTAAHCVHNGNRYKRNIDMLKVEVPEMIGSRLYYVVEIKVPVMWMKTQTLPEVARGAYDYAVLKLNLPVGGRNTFMRLSLPSMSALSSDLRLLSIRSDRSHRLLESTCHPDSNLIVMNGNVLLTACDSTDRGSSGSALFTNNREEARIVGVLSNSITTTSGNIDFDAIMLLTLQKCLDICSMIYPEGDEYNSCGDIRSRDGNLKSLRHKTMPMFG